MKTCEYGTLAKVWTYVKTVPKPGRKAYAEIALEGIRRGVEGKQRIAYRMRVMDRGTNKQNDELKSYAGMEGGLVIVKHDAGSHFGAKMEGGMILVDGKEAQSFVDGMRSEKAAVPSSDISKSD